MAPVFFIGVYLPLEHDPVACHKEPLYMVYHNSHFSTLKAEQNGGPVRVVQVPIVEADGSTMLPVQFCNAADGDAERCVDEYLDTCTVTLKDGSACRCALGSAVLGSDELQELRFSLLAPLDAQPAADGLVKVGAADWGVGFGPGGGGGEEAAARADEKLQSLVEMTEPAAVSMEEADTDKSMMHVIAHVVYMRMYYMCVCASKSSSEGAEHMEPWQPVESKRRGQKEKRSDPVSCTNYWSSLQEHTKRKKRRKKKPKKKGHAGDVERESDGSRPVEADGPRTKQPDAPEYEAERTLPAHGHGKAKKKKCRDAKSARPAVVVAPPLETARTDAMPQNVTNDTPMSRPKTRIITKMAPAQCGIDEMTTTSSCKEAKKKRKSNKKGWQERHETERKPLEAERALRTMWDSEPEYTAEHACAVLAKLIACRHLTPSAFESCSLVEDICKRLQTHKTVQLKHKVDAADGGCQVQASNVGVECPAPEPAAQRCSLTGGSVQALLLLPLSCCAALSVWLAPGLSVWLAPGVKTGPSGSKERKKKRKKEKKKGGQKRHKSDRKPLKAEKADKTLWDSIPECTAEHACAILAPAAQSRSQQKKTKCKPANDGRKVTASNVGCQCPASKPVAQRRSLMGGSLRSLLPGLLLLSCCAALGIWLSSDVTTGPSSFASSPLPTLSHHQLPHHVNTSRHPWALEPLTPCREFALGTIVSHHHVNTSRHHWALEPPTPHCEFAVGTIVSHHHVNTSLHHWALAPPTPRCEFAVGTSSPYVTSYASHQHAQEASFSPKVFFLYVECVSLPPLPVPNTHDVALIHAHATCHPPPPRLCLMAIAGVCSSYIDTGGASMVICVCVCVCV